MENISNPWGEKKYKWWKRNKISRLLRDEHQNYMHNTVKRKNNTILGQNRLNTTKQMLKGCCSGVEMLGLQIPIKTSLLVLHLWTVKTSWTTNSCVHVCGYVLIQTKYHVNSLSENQGTQFLHKMLVYTEILCNCHCHLQTYCIKKLCGFSVVSQVNSSRCSNKNVNLDIMNTQHSSIPISVLVNSTLHAGHQEFWLFFFTQKTIFVTSHQNVQL